MKKLFILHVLLCFWLWNYAQSYEDYSKVSKIGYSTNYSNGKFNSGVYKSSMTTLEYQNRAFTGTYNPSSSSSGGSRQSGPRKVAGYTGSGEYVDDGKGYGDSDSTYFWGWTSSGTYYYYDGNWYLYEDGEWCIWKYGNSYRRWGRTYYENWGWYYSTTNPDYYNPFSPSQDPGDYEMKPNLTPIGDAIVPLFLLLILYLAIKKKNLSRENC